MSKETKPEVKKEKAAKAPTKAEAAALASAEAKSKSMIRPCNCTHAYQESKYGPGMRVHNPGKAPVGGKAKFKCTVCGTVKGFTLIELMVVIMIIAVFAAMIASGINHFHRGWATDL